MRWVASSALSESFANDPSKEKKNCVAGGRASKAAWPLSTKIRSFEIEVVQESRLINNDFR